MSWLGHNHGCEMSTSRMSHYMKTMSEWKSMADETKSFLDLFDDFAQLHTKNESLL